MKRWIIVGTAFAVTPAAAADFVGTRSIVEPVTQHTRIIFFVKEADASLLIGCSNAGNGAVTIAVAPDFMKSPDDNMFRLPDHRFGNAAKAQSGHWMVSDDQLVFDESKLGAISRKAKFLDEMARD